MKIFECIRRNTHYFFLIYSLLISSIALANNTVPDQLKSILTESLADSLTLGAVLLVSSPTIGTITVAAGLANKADQVPMKETNNFRLASMSKTFLAVTVLKLIDESELNLDDKIADLLPSSMDIDRLPNGKNVTVKQLLQMRSGIPNYTDYDG